MKPVKKTVRVRKSCDTVPLWTIVWIHLKLCELVVSPDVCVVGGERHEEVDQREHHQEAGDRRDDEHHLKMLKFLCLVFLYFEALGHN